MIVINREISNLMSCFQDIPGTQGNFKQIVLTKEAWMNVKVALQAVSVGDLVEFISDKHTDKGPCTGRVKGLHDNNVFVSLSDSYEAFPHALFTSCKFNYKGHPLWMIE